MKNIKILNKITMLLFILIVGSCETLDLDTLDNPNSLDPSKISINDGMTNFLDDFKGFFNSSQSVGSRLTRLNYMFGSTYQNAMGPDTGGSAWTGAYTGLFNDSQFILNKMDELNIDAPLHKGIIKAANAYALMTLVDYWGDVPYSEAFQGVGNLNPAVDSGSDVYLKAHDMLLEAKVLLEAASNQVDDDGNVINNVPGGSKVLNMFFENAETEQALTSSWLKFVDSVLFKYYLNTDNVAELNNLLADNNLIQMNGESCAYRYSAVNNPESRHPSYVSNYGNNPTAYMSNSLMYKMVSHPDNPNPDPRGAFYFYRQSTSFPGPNDNPSLGDALPCSDDASPYPVGVAFCAFGDGYWGRDHGDADGIPPDSDTRTTYGAYPIGGLVDTGSGGSVSDEDGMNGAGISPVLMAFQLDLMRAEAVLRLGVNGDARFLLQSGMYKSIEYVTSFTGDAPLDANTYVTNVLNDYDAADDDGKMQIIGEQMWIASFGSGTEMYNFYRRTGYPNNLQPHLLGTGAGNFPRSMFYPSNTANLNLSINQKANLDESVFWADPSIQLQ